MGRTRLDGPRLPLGIRGIMVWMLAIASAFGIAWWDLREMVDSGAFDEAVAEPAGSTEGMVEFEVAPLVESEPADAGTD